jgi:hypothetical protein
MDNFDYDSLENYIRKYKRNIVNKLENIQLNEKSMRNQADLLCMVLDYSPRIVEERKVSRYVYTNFLKLITIRKIQIKKFRWFNSRT